MWKTAAIIFVVLTVSPGALIILGMMLGDLPSNLGEIGAVLWLLIMAGCVGSGVRSGIHEARKAERLSRRQCVECGYDLRAAEGRCPECGTPVTQGQSVQPPQ
jgi:hypothetical protein